MFSSHAAGATVICTALLLGGCASSQLNYNTVDIANRSDDILTKQVKYNLIKYIEDPLAVPAQIDVESGTTGTSYSLMPSVTFPFSPMSQFASTGTTAMGGSNSNTNTTTRAGVGGSLSGNDTWQQNYIFTAVTDNERFLRLNALYQFAVSGDPADLNSFIPIHKTISTNTPQCLKSVYVSSKDIQSPELVNPGRSKLCATSLSFGKNPQPPQEDTKTASITGYTKSESFQVVDEWFDRGGLGCILCALKKKENLHWLHWQSVDPRILVPPGAEVKVGDTELWTNDGITIYVANGKHEAYVQFLSAILASLNASTFSNAGGANSGGAAGSNNSSGSNSNQLKPQFFQQLL